MENLKLVRSLLERIKNSSDLVEAKAYADAIELVLSQDKRVSVRLSAMFSLTGNKIGAIKELRTVFGLGLLEAKTMVENGHTWENLEPELANALKVRLEALGGSVEVL